MPRVRPPLAALVAAVLLGAALTLGIVVLAGGFDDSKAASNAPPAITDAAVGTVAAPPSGYAAAIYRARVRSVVTVLVDQGDGQAQTFGSGFVANARKGLIITASHVVTSSAGATDPRKVQPYGPIYVMRSDGARTPVTIVGYDLFDDIAVLHYDPEQLALAEAPLGDSSNVRVGDLVAAIGAPFGQAESLSAGLVSQIGNQIEAPAAICLRTTDALQTDAAINPGNSGGPLFDAKGRVIGVNSQIDVGSSGRRAGSGVAFAVPIDAARRSLAGLVANGVVPYAWFGVGGITLTPDIVSALELPATTGLQVTFVDAGSAAARAGISRGSATSSVNGRVVRSEADIIVGFDGKPVRTLQDLQHAVNAKRPGDRVQVVWWHGGSKREREIVLGARRVNDPEVCRATAAP